MKVDIEASWHKVLEQEFEKNYFVELTKFVKSEYSKSTCYPAFDDIYKAFELCPFDQVKVVIIGQDPYINPNQAHGLCFSVLNNLILPPSLKNIYKELENDLSISNRTSGNLTHWAEQGVLLLNATLTVKSGESNSHAGKGWELFTDAVIHKLNQQKESLVYLLWGAYAQKKAKMVNPDNNLLLKSVHPSPLSAYRGFFGCSHFSKTNLFLEEKGKSPIKW